MSLEKITFSSNILFIKRVQWNHPFITGKSMSEALIFASTNPQYDERLFIKIENCKLRTSGEHDVYIDWFYFYFCFDLQNKLCTQHVLLMLRASEKDITVIRIFFLDHFKILKFFFSQSLEQFCSQCTQAGNQPFSVF